MVEVLKYVGALLAALFLISVVATAGDLTPYLLAVPVGCLLLWCVITDYFYH